MSKEPDAIILGLRVAVLPNPYVPSIQRICSRCGEPVWISKRLAEDPNYKELSVICLPCAAKV